MASPDYTSLSTLFETFADQLGYSSSDPVIQQIAQSFQSGQLASDLDTALEASAAVSGKSAVFYSGSVPVSGSSVAVDTFEQLAKPLSELQSGKYYIAADTPLYAALKGPTGAQAKALNTIAEILIQNSAPTYFDKMQIALTKTLGVALSERFAAQATGNAIAFIQNGASANSVFQTYEAPLMKNLTSLNSVPVTSETTSAQIIKIGQQTTAEYMAGIPAVDEPGVNGSTANFNKFVQTTDPQSVFGSPEFQANYRANSGNPIPEGPEVTSEFEGLRGVASTSFKILGAAGIAYDTLHTGAQAAELVQAGDNEGAAHVMTDLAARLYTSFLGAEAGAAAGAAIFSETGPGAAVAALIGGIGGGIAAGFYGQKAVDAIWDGVKNVINYLTGSAAVPQTPVTSFSDPTAEQTYQVYLDEGAPQAAAQGAVQLAQLQVKAELLTNPNANLATDLQQTQTDVDNNIAVQEATAPSGVDGSVQSTGTQDQATLSVSAAIYNPNGAKVSSVSEDSSGGIVETNYDANGNVISETALVPNGDQFSTNSTGVGIELPYGGTLENGGSITGGSYGVYSPSGATTIDNKGQIDGTNDGGVFIGGPGLVTNDDAISGANGIQIDGFGKVVNADVINATGGTGVSIGDGGSVTNGSGDKIQATVNGVIISGATGAVNDSGSIDANSGTGVDLGDGGTVSLTTSAAVIKGGSYGVYSASGTTTVNNKGQIDGTNDGGVFIGGPGLVTNDDAISGANGIQIDGFGKVVNADVINATGGTGVSIGDGGSVTNGSGDKIQATVNGVIISGATGAVTDSGSIDANSGTGVDLGDGGTVSLTTSATIVGGAYGVYAASGSTTVNNKSQIDGTNDGGVFIGGPGVVTNDDQISGANGIQIDGSGKVVNADMITATSGTGVSIGDGGSLTNGSGDKIQATVNGVIISGATGAVTDSGSIDANSGTGVDLGDGGTVTLQTRATIIGGAYGVYSASGSTTVNNKGQIVGTNDGGVFIGGTGVVINDDQITGANGIQIDGFGKVVNADAITATGGTGVSIGDGGSVTNGSGDKIQAAVNGVIISGATGAVTDSGSIDANSGTGVDLGDGGTVTLQTSATIIGGAYGVYSASGSTTVNNKGQIVGTNDGGVFIGGTGVVINDDQITGANGIQIDGFGKVVNADAITATSGTGVSIGDGGSVTNGSGDKIQAAVNGVIISGATGAVTDSGSIDATSGTGIDLGDGGTVSLTTTATVIGGAYGVYSASGATTLNNNGTITGTNDSGVFTGGADSSVTNNGTITGSVGVVMDGAGSTLKNSGVIDGTSGVAAELAEGVTLALGGGGSFDGKVESQGPADATLELTAGDGDGELTDVGDGGNLEAFGSLLVDAGSDWTLLGNDSFDDSFTNDGDVSVGDDTAALALLSQPQAAAAVGSSASPGGSQSATLKIGGSVNNKGTISLYSTASKLSQLLIGGGVDNAGTIVDGASGAVKITGALSGAGTVDLSGGGSLSVGSAAGGAIALGSGGGHIYVTSGAIFDDALSNWGAGDSIDFSSETYASTDILGYAENTSANGGVVTVKTKAGATMAEFDVLGSLNSTYLHLGADASNHVLISYQTGEASSASHLASASGLIKS